MLLMVVRGIRTGICHAIHRHTKANNKYVKDYDKNKESSYLKYWDVNSFYSWAMSQKVPVSKFEQIEDTYLFNEDLRKKVIKDIFSKLIFSILKNYMNSIIIYPFYQKE